MVWELIKDLLLVSLGMGIGVVLMCIIAVMQHTFPPLEVG